MIKVSAKGDFRKTEKFLKKSFGRNYESILKKYGEKGVNYLSSATPMDSGETAASWYYEIIQNDSYMSIVWKNRNVVKGVNIAVIIQYGHATRNGGFVEGIDYINPALRPIFDELADACWKEVIKI